MKELGLTDVITCFAGCTQGLSGLSDSVEQIGGVELDRAECIIIYIYVYTHLYKYIDIVIYNKCIIIYVYIYIHI